MNRADVMRRCSDEVCARWATNLPALRRIFNLKQRDLADRLGVSRAWLSALENCKAPLTQLGEWALVGFFLSYARTQTLVRGNDALLVDLVSHAMTHKIACLDATSVVSIKFADEK